MGFRKSVLAGSLGNLAAALVIILLGLWIAAIGENQGGVILRDLSAQVQLVPDWLFGLLPITINGESYGSMEQKEIISYRVPGRGEYGGALYNFASCDDGVGRIGGRWPTGQHGRRYRLHAYHCKGIKDGHELGWNVLFFFDGSLLGRDEDTPDHKIFLRDRTGDTITVEYSIMHWSGDSYVDTGASKFVHFRLSNNKNKMFAQDEIPPAASHERDGR